MTMRGSIGLHIYVRPGGSGRTGMAAPTASAVGAFGLGNGQANPDAGGVASRVPGQRKPLFAKARIVL
jgi:hypothetical protein